MKYKELDKFVEDNNLLKHVIPKPGIYAITIDDCIAYIGQSKNMIERCKQHIYKTENAMLVNEHKYLLLLSAKLGGHSIDCVSVEVCSEEDLTEKEMDYINKYSPCLNILTPDGKQDITKLKIEDVLGLLEYQIITDEKSLDKALQSI